MASVSWRDARAGKAKGRDLLTLLLGHGRALHGTLSVTPEWACLRAPSVESKFARFEKDSSRSYANCSFCEKLSGHVVFSRTRGHYAGAGAATMAEFESCICAARGG